MRIDLDTLPVPIASAYRRIRACHAQDAKRLKNILQTAEMTARLLGVAALADLRQALVAGRVAPAPALARFIDALRRPSFGHWIEILRESVRVLRQSAMFIPEFESIVFKGNGMAQPYELLSEILTLRNRFAHGDMSAPEIARACVDAEARVTELLAALEFFEAYPFYFVRRIRVRKRALAACSYTHEFWLLNGPYADPEAVSEERDWHTDSDEVIIQRVDERFLNLDPLLIYLDRDAYDKASKLQPDLYIFNGFQRSGAGLVADFLPCGPSGQEFSSKILPEQEREMISLGLEACFQAFVPDAGNAEEAA